jgi:lantibiotic biosynthesis protein
MSGAPPAPADGAPWRALLDGPARLRALRTVDALAADVTHAYRSERRDGSLASGSAGISLFYAQVARAMGSDDAVDRATASLDDAIDVVATEPLDTSLYAGFTGVAWATELFGKLLDVRGDDRNGDVDEALSDFLALPRLEQAPFDLIFGLTGLGVYALERWPRGRAVDLAFLVVDHLRWRARRDEHGAYWWTPPSLLLGSSRDRSPAGGVDLGVAHGVAGVIPFLARARALGIGGASTRSLLDGAVEWLLAHAVDTNLGPTIPAFIGAGAEPRRTRSAWCYGDPGVAAALLVSGREARQPRWTDAGLQLALRAADRPAVDTGVMDAGFCHGSSGLAHLFNRMHQMTGEPRLAEAARFWLERTLDYCELGRDASTPAIAGAPGRPWNGVGVLEGAAGVGLVLLAASTTAEPVWDRMFLVSRLPPAGYAQ